MTNPNQHLNKALSMEIISTQINVSITKTQLAAIVADILASEDNASLLRAITPALSGKFPQFPDFTNVSITGIDETGAASITLKQPVLRAKSEPTDVTTDADNIETPNEPAEVSPTEEPTE